MQKYQFTFTNTNDNEESAVIYNDIQQTLEVADDATWSEMVEHYLKFLNATGYIIDRATIDRVSDFLKADSITRYEEIKKRNRGL